MRSELEDRHAAPRENHTRLAATAVEGLTVTHAVIVPTEGSLCCYDCESKVEAQQLRTNHQRLSATGGRNAERREL